MSFGEVVFGMVHSVTGCKLDQKKLQWIEVLKEESTIFTKRESLLAYGNRPCLTDTDPLRRECYIVYLFANNKLKRAEPAQDIKRLVYTSLKHITATKTN